MLSSSLPVLPSSSLLFCPSAPADPPAFFEVASRAGRERPLAGVRFTSFVTAALPEFVEPFD